MQVESQKLPGKVTKLEGKADETGYRVVKQAEGGCLSIKTCFNAGKEDGEFKPTLSLCNQPHRMCQSAGVLASVTSSDELAQ